MRKTSAFVLALAILLLTLACGQQPRIAFHSDRDGNWDIYVMNADGSDPTRLTDNPAGDTWPSWSPDGRRIAFHSSRDDPDPNDDEDVWDIYVMNADGSDLTRLTDNSAWDSYPRWSPDGQRIAFQSYGDGNWDIYVMNSDGTGRTRLTDDPASDDGPSWSPTGRSIAFYSDRDGNREIYVMNADGSSQTRLTDNPAPDLYPSWSPNGRSLAFASGRDDPGIRSIYVMNADGSGQTRLTDNAAWDWAPRWSPDGRSMAFVSDRDDPDPIDGNRIWSIYVMNADGSGQTRLSDSMASDSGPDWSPK